MQSYPRSTCALSYPVFGDQWAAIHYLYQYLLVGPPSFTLRSIRQGGRAASQYMTAYSFSCCFPTPLLLSSQLSIGEADSLHVCSSTTFSTVSSLSAVLSSQYIASRQQYPSSWIPINQYTRHFFFITTIPSHHQVSVQHIGNCLLIIVQLSSPESIAWFASLFYRRIFQYPINAPTSQSPLSVASCYASLSTLRTAHSLLLILSTIPCQTS